MAGIDSVTAGSDSVTAGSDSVTAPASKPGGPVTFPAASGNLPPPPTPACPCAPGSCCGPLGVGWAAVPSHGGVNEQQSRPCSPTSPSKFQINLI